MSIKFDTTKLASLAPSDFIQKAKKECTVIGKESDYGMSPRLFAYSQTRYSLFLPFSYARKLYPEAQVGFTDGFSKMSKRVKFDKSGFPFKLELQNNINQKEVFTEALQILNTHRSILLSLFCGFGKTYLGIRLSVKIGLKTVILYHRGCLALQWEQSITAYVKGARIQLVSKNDKLDPNADFYLINIANVSKFRDREIKQDIHKKLNFYDNVAIGTLIIDEVHVACAKEMAKAKRYFRPKYMIGLSATPHREDGLDGILNLYYGKFAEVRGSRSIESPETTQIVRISQSKFRVMRVNTGIKPAFATNTMGRKDWNSLLTSLFENEERNRIIFDIIVESHAADPNNNIMVLTKRKNHCELLKSMLTEAGIHSTIMVGSQTSYDMDARVLLSTFSKLGVGFDDKRLNILVLAVSIKEVEQYAGRLRAGLKDRIIYDLVDSDPNCFNHWKQRRRWYLSRRGFITGWKSAVENGGDDDSDDGNRTEYVRLAPRAK